MSKRSILCTTWHSSRKRKQARFFHAHTQSSRLRCPPNCSSEHLTSPHICISCLPEFFKNMSKAQVLMLSYKLGWSRSSLNLLSQVVFPRLENGPQWHKAWSFLSTVSFPWSGVGRWNPYIGRRKTKNDSVIVLLWIDPISCFEHSFPGQWCFGKAADRLADGWAQARRLESPGQHLTAMPSPSAVSLSASRLLCSSSVTGGSAVPSWTEILPSFLTPFLPFGQSHNSS